MPKKISIKTTPAKVDVATPTSISNIELLIKDIVTAKTANDLNNPAVLLITLREAYDKINKDLKESIAIETNKSKDIKSKIDDIENTLKEQALKVVEVETKNKVNASTGEITKKITHNLSTELFSYTPPKKSAAPDTKAMLADPKKYKKFLKPVTTFEVDFEAIDKAKADDLPWIENKAEAKISFKKKLSADIKAKLLNA